MANGQGKRALIVGDAFFYGEAWLTEWLLRQGWGVDLATPASGGTKPLDQGAALRALAHSPWVETGRLRFVGCRQDAAGGYDLGVLHADYPASLGNGFLREGQWEHALKACRRLAVMALNFAGRWKAPVQILQHWPFLTTRRAVFVSLDDRRGSVLLRALFRYRHLGGVPHMQFLLDPQLARRLREPGDPRQLRRYRIGFAGSTNADREAAADAVRELAGARGYAVKDARAPDWPGNGAPGGREVLLQLDVRGADRARDPGEYLDYLDMCDFQLCPSGAGFWTVRSYESCLRLSAPISERRQILDFLGREVRAEMVTVKSGGWRDAVAECLDASVGAVVQRRQRLAKNVRELLRRQDSLASSIAGI